MNVEFGVLGPVTAWDDAGDPLPLRGPRHRAVLARLVVARGRVVPRGVLVDDLWDGAPPPGAVGALQTFVSALRRALEPERPPRAPARLLVSAGSGYALRAGPASVDAWRFEQAVVPGGALDRALASWRGPAYADLPDHPWVRIERDRLTELRLHAVELRAAARLALGLDTVADLFAHTAAHPWREEGWRLLALALYRAGRQADAADVLRRARIRLADALGMDPGPGLRALESDILRQSDHLTRVDEVWDRVTAGHDRTVAAGTRTRLRSAVDLLRTTAVAGGVEEVRELRLATILAAERHGDPELTAAVIGAYDVPAVWSRSDDPAQAAEIVAAARRTLAALPPGARPGLRARLLATIGLESRGAGGPAARAAAREAERIARGADDPALLAFALNALFMQSFHRTGLAGRRDALGAEVVHLAARHGLVPYEILGSLIRMQARAALGDLAGADLHAATADRLGERHESPLVEVFTSWYRAMRTGTGAACLAAAATLDGAGMPGLQRGLLPLALLALRPDGPPPVADGGWGPYLPWARPLVLLARDDRDGAARAVADVPDPPHDHLAEALWCLVARAAVAVGDRATTRRAVTALTPAVSEIAAGSGLLSLGRVARHLDAARRWS